MMAKTKKTLPPLPPSWRAHQLRSGRKSDAMARLAAQFSEMPSDAAALAA